MRQQPTFKPTVKILTCTNCGITGPWNGNPLIGYDEATQKTLCLPCLKLTPGWARPTTTH